MSDRRVFRWATTSARMLVGTLVSIAAVVAVVTAVSVTWPTLSRQPLGIATVPAPAASVLVCDGGLLSIGRDAMNAGALGSVTSQSVTSGVEEGRPAPQEQHLQLPQAPDGTGPAAFIAQPDGRERVDVAAAGSATVAADDLTGFAASACRPPLLESWLVGGSGTTGAADLVVLSNPGTVPATVQLTVYGASGPQNPPGGVDIIVPPGTQRVVPLSGVALDQASPVVRVSAVGAPVHASLQASITRTLTPGGVDQVGAIPQPAQSQTIAGVTVTAAPGAAGASDAATVLRMLSPAADATVTVTVTAEGRDSAARDPQELTLVAGQPAELALPGLATGSYTIQVDADQPVVAAAWQATGFAEGDDFAWYTPSPDVAEPSLFAVPSGPPATFTVVNPGDETATVSVTPVDGGDADELTVPAQGTASVRLPSRTVYLLETDASVRAALSLTGDGALAGMPIWPADAAAPEIIVYP